MLLHGFGKFDAQRQWYAQAILWNPLTGEQKQFSIRMLRGGMSRGVPWWSKDGRYIAFDLGTLGGNDRFGILDTKSGEIIHVEEGRLGRRSAAFVSKVDGQLWRMSRQTNLRKTENISPGQDPRHRDLGAFQVRGY